MTIVKILDDVTEWARKNICAKIELKVPPKNGEANDHGYDYKRVNPAAFTMFVPTEDRLPPDVPSAFPSLCVRFMDAEDDFATMKGTVGIQFLLSVWNPGTHGQDRVPPMEGTENRFERNGEGWRDIWNFTDMVVQAVESTTNISGYKIDRSVPVKFGPLAEQDAVPDYYPFWFTWVTFQLTYPLQRSIENVQEFL